MPPAPNDPRPLQDSTRLRFEPGQQLGRYRLLALLGRGGMGEVYRAQDRELGREVALKLLSRVDRQRVERFQREAELTAKLVHPGIVRLHAFEAAQGQPFLVCELIEQAETLTEAFRPRDLRERVALVRDAARALGYAHAQGVVHRDVKPDNVLVGADGQARVTDFGLALDVDADRLTHSGALVGTPQYMAPEQIAGQRQEVGPWSDVWALGVILYEACQGSRPFQGEGLMALSAQVVAADPPPLSRPAGGLQGVVDRALAKRPEARYPTAAGLADDLDAWLGGAAFAGARGRRTRRLTSLVTLLVVTTLAFVVAWPRSPAGPVSGPVLAPSPDPRESVAPAPVSLDGVFEGDDASRLAAAHDLLLAHPDHPQAARVEAIRRSLAAQLPLATLPVAARTTAIPAWDGDTLLLPDRGALVRYGATGQRLASLAVPAWGQIAPLGDRWVLRGRPPDALWAVDAALERAEALLSADAPAKLIPDPQGRYVGLAMGSGAQLLVVDRQGQTTGQLQLDPGHRIQAGAFTPDGERLLLIDLYVDPQDDLHQFTELVLLQLPACVELGRERTEMVLNALDYHPGGRLALGARAGGLFIVEAHPAPATPWSERWTQVRPTEGSDTDPEGLLAVAHPGGVDALAWSPGGHLLSAGQRGDRDPCLLRLWDVDGAREIRPARELLPSPAEAIVPAPSGRYVAVVLKGRPPFVLLGED